MKSELIAFQTILAAKQEDQEAIDQILSHYSGLVRTHSVEIARAISILVTHKPLPAEDAHDLIENIMEFISAKLLIAIVMKFDPTDNSQEQ